MIRSLRRYRAYAPLIALLLIGALAGFTLQERNGEHRMGPSLISRDARPEGTLALAMWLERMGYSVSRIEWSIAVPDSSVDLLFLLRPTRRVDPNEAVDLIRWVSDGGRLVYHPNLLFTSPSSPTPSDGLSEPLGLEARRISRVARSSVGLPLLTRPDLADVGASATMELLLRDSSWVPLLLNDARVLGASRALGRGRVYAFTTPALFDNQSLPENGNRDVLLSLLARHPDARRVAFDEYHHGPVRGPDVMSAVRSTPWGWALLYAIAATLVFLVWGGRRFGPAIIPERPIGRSTGDYVSALAGLIQRSGSVGWVQREVARLSRHELSRLLGTRIDTPNAELVSALQGRRGAPTDLATSMLALEGPSLTERELLGHVRNVERGLRGLHGAEGPRPWM